MGMFESLSSYKALVFDYSVMFEAGGTRAFDELLDVIMKNGIEVYVGKSFKMLHYCVVRQADTKNGKAIDAMKTFGADSFAGRLSSMFQGATDTTFYIIAVYFGSVGIKKTRHALTCALISDAVGIISAIAIAYLFFPPT